MRRLLISFCVIAGMGVPSYAQTLERGASVIQAQSVDAGYRISVLEEQVRQLNGRIEELTFQLLELQEQIRRTQEDNDFRLRELEDKQGNLGGDNPTDNLALNSGDTGLEKPQPSEQNNSVESSGGETTALGANEEPKRTIDGVEIYNGEGGVGDSGTGTLGTIQFDENGNIIDTELGKPFQLGSSGQVNSVLQLPQKPDALFDLGYNSVQTGRYEDAERALIAFSQNHATHPLMPEARFWLGESHLGRKQFQEAARVYMDAHRQWPSAKYGPQSLLKLGVSVAGLDQRELACATFAEVLIKYPNASNAIKRSVAYEQQAARCNVN